MGKHKKNKSRYIFISVLIIITVIGSIQIVHSLNGGYIQEKIEPIPLWKQYSVGFPVYNQPGIVSAQAQYFYGLSNIRGDLNLKTTLFSTNNEIDVEVILEPDFLQSMTSTAVFTTPEGELEELLEEPNSEIVFSNLMDALPQNYFVIFVGAENIENLENNDRFAIIKLTRNSDYPVIHGGGTIMFDLSGEREILFLDPDELSEFLDIRKEFTSDTISFRYTVKNSTGFTPPSDPDMKYALVSPDAFAFLVDGKTVYTKNIQSADALDNLEIQNLTYAAIGMATVIAGLSIFIPLILRKSKD